MTKKDFEKMLNLSKTNMPYIYKKAYKNIVMLQAFANRVSKVFIIIKYYFWSQNTLSNFNQN